MYSLWSTLLMTFSSLFVGSGMSIQQAVAAPFEPVVMTNPYAPEKMDAYVASAKQQRMALYVHLEQIMHDYPFMFCNDDPTSCIDYIQTNLFTVTGYNASRGVDGFASIRQQEKVRYANEYVHLPTEKKLIVDYFDILLAEILLLTRHPLHTYQGYTTDIVGLIRGLQLQIKYALLLLDPSGKDLPRDAVLKITGE